MRESASLLAQAVSLDTRPPTLPGSEHRGGRKPPFRLKAAGRRSLLFSFSRHTIPFDHLVLKLLAGNMGMTRGLATHLPFVQA